MSAQTSQIGPPARMAATGESSADRAAGARLLTPDEAAARWGVKRSQVYRLAREGRVPTVWVGRYPRFRVADLETWEQNGGVGQ